MILLLLSEGESSGKSTNMSATLIKHLVILEMRVYAIYGRKKLVLALMIFLQFLSLAVFVLQLVNFLRMSAVILYTKAY